MAKPFSASQARRATSWVLPRAGEASVVPAEIVGGVDPLGDDQARPARGGAGDDPQRLAVGLGEAVDRRVGADERGIDRPGQQRLDRLAAGVEVGDLQRDVGSQCLGEGTVVDADDRWGVGHVREVAEAQRHGLGLGGMGSSRRRGRTGDEGDNRRGAEHNPSAVERGGVNSD